MRQNKKEETLKDYNDTYMKTVLKDYRLVDILGEGTYKKVFLAEYGPMRQKRVVKITNPMKDAKYHDRMGSFFRSRKQAQEKYGLRYLEEILEVYLYQNSYIIVGNVHEPYEKYKNRLTDDEIIKLGCDMCCAIYELGLLTGDHNEHFIHRDIKPQNILYDFDHDCYVLTDFGSIKIIKDGTVYTKLEAVTPAFAPPESLNPNYTEDTARDVKLKYQSIDELERIIKRAKNQRAYYPNGDTFSLGMTLLYLLTGQYLCDFDDHHFTKNERLNEILAKSLDYQPSGRYHEIGDMFTALYNLLPDHQKNRIPQKYVDGFQSRTVFNHDLVAAISDGVVRFIVPGFEKVEQ